MDQPEISRAELPGMLARGAWVVTATRRLARALHLEYARHSSRESWPTPRILPWSAWIQHQYRELRDFGRLSEPQRCLDETQSAALWEQVLARDETASRLLLSAGVAEGFRDAWRLVHEWRLPWGELHARAHEDCRVFLRVARAYQRELDQRQALDGAQLAGVVAAGLAGTAGDPVVLAGFDRFTPAQQAMVSSLGARAHRLAAAGHRPVPQVLAFGDARAELAAAAAWARQQLEADPGARIGIVVPELEAHAPVLEQLLDDAVAPARLWPGHGDDPRPWNISLARPLGATPLAAAALELLAFAQGPMSLATVSRALRTPFTAAALTEGPDRARLEAWLREHSSEPIMPDALLRGLRGEGRAPGCPVLAAALTEALELLAETPRRRPASRWAADFSRALRVLGWPGEATLDSAEWQTLQAWSEALDALAGLDAVAGGLTLAEALTRLRRVLAERRFQPESPEVPIQVLGMPETAGLEFDALWVTGLHDGILPAALRPSALLPAALQRERAMPRACPDTERALAGRLVARLAASAGQVGFSYPLLEGDEPLRPSPALAPLGVPGAGASGRPGVAEILFAARRLEELTDQHAPPLGGAVRGGSALLGDQSACPFRAFALHRLRAHPLESARAGVDPRQRGSFLHDALRRLWETWGSQATAAGLEPHARTAAVRAAARPAAAQHLAGVPRGLVEIELEAGVQVIEQLVAADLERPPFAIAGCERPFELELGLLRIRGRMDRIDRVGEALVVIDYKTGAAAPADWDGERPGQPQMPLYALAQAEAVAALAYGSLKPGEVGYRGRQRAGDDDPLLLPGKQTVAVAAPEWEEMLAQWRRVLAGLAQDFAAGRAPVDPLRPQQRDGSCAHCPLPVLCRRDELLRAGAIGDE
ncbi:PD-(D/E)XK nuclease family protein [Thioalkalivibrio sp. XN8]|uniref:PD-(D/E)XK nuclease family protein n=1 Tax=Thioalkalivibrio sp. XN8 TaxID=2712863 RepID=UPI0013EBD5A7|nr:PD-(D/E)XK nuclease family protein [Thioalkalivibrio sp. XN8]NGP54662.1 hypothetical protein [Thioalkalivibrio sp. XN8]